MKMTVHPNALLRRTFIGAYRIHGNMDGAKQAAEHLELEPYDSSTNVHVKQLCSKWQTE
jgi:hypothetical protein